MRTGRHAALLGVVLALLATACAPVQRTTITVLASWTGAEEESFALIRERFEEKTGIEVNYEGTRAMEQVLQSGVQKGEPPDVAILPSAGELKEYVDQDLVYELDPARGYEPPAGQRWPVLPTLGLGETYAVIAKADLKSLVWHRGEVPDPPETWEELQALPGRWCLGLDAPPVPGWPGTDWIEDIFLQQQGSAEYQKWATGVSPWYSDEMKQAWRTWEEVVADSGPVDRDPTAALLTDFTDAGRGMFADPEQCSFDHAASFIQGSYATYPDVAGESATFDYFRFPRFGPRQEPQIVSADLAVLPKRPADDLGTAQQGEPRPEAEEFLHFLATEEAQAIWATRKMAGSSAYSVNAGIAPETYPDQVSQKIARTLTTSPQLCFDASDLMPPGLRNAFYRGVLEFARDPSRLDEILGKLDHVQAEAMRQDRSRGDGPLPLEFPCGVPAG
ncbi:ABC transporter substrate-binding protein [Saccharopolyspora sp. K220]|uniref:ABC transporter substrate-binding protein n=1 Tax=Saccharopolyspora soli TaxID=2926618 RepID=UPI001F578416|nr:ABC transporter substrate-binding protein [Saccharopolyspora soli]MCI2423686.1 ABC transporter substrate-binding protein [Saccharopolyspora soli]